MADDQKWFDEQSGQENEAGPGQKDQAAPDAGPTYAGSGATPSANEKDMRMWCMLCHLSALVLGVIGPLIVWMIKKDEMPEVEQHGKEAVNFQISIIIYMVVSGFLTIVFIGIFMLPLIVIFNLAMVIVAGVKANNGEFYRYPATIRFLK